MAAIVIGISDYTFDSTRVVVKVCTVFVQNGIECSYGQFRVRTSMSMPASWAGVHGRLSRLHQATTCVDDPNSNN